MVDLEEVDDEGQPLRYEEEAYHKKYPSLFESVVARFRPLVTCWRHCRMSLAIWITLVFFGIVCIIGVLVLAGDKAANTPQYPQCNRLYRWVMFWVIVNGVNAVWHAIEEGFRVPPYTIDPDAPGGVRETPLHEQNSTLYLYVRAFRLITQFVLMLVFFIVGYDLVKHGTCDGFRDLKLYFKVNWYMLLVGYGIIALFILCGGCVACCALLSASRERARRTAAQYAE